MLNKLLLLLVLFGFVFSSPSIRQQFLEFQLKFHKSYATHQEFERRFQNFKDNLQWSEELNKANPKATFGPTKFSDMSREEFASLYLMKPQNWTINRPPVKVFNGPPSDSTNVDWRKSGCITPVYDQGQCGSCWAFSATETIESYFFLAGNALRRLSMEQIVDCDTNDDGCGGGYPASAYQYVQSAPGIDSYTSYPYTAGGGQASSCQFNSQNVITNVAGSQTISGEDGLYQQAGLAQSNGGGPVSVCVDASSWQNYQGGILTSCGSSIDHCVQLVGYQNYGNANSACWLVRNSWSTQWGENGYIRIAIGQDLCAIGDAATIVSIASN